MQPDQRHHLSLCVSKVGDARFLGHLDFARVIERSLRRSGLPVQYTQGFNPHIKVTHPEALPVGVASTGQWVTLSLTEDVPPLQVRERLEPALPEGVRLVEVRRGRAPATDGSVRYRLALLSGADSVADALTDLLARDEMLVPDPRREVPVDARASLEGGRVEGHHLVLDLVAVDGRPPRPGPVVSALLELAREPAPRFGVATKLGSDERRPGDDTWPDAGGAPPASCSSTPSSPKSAASRSCTAASSTSTT